MDKEYVDEVLCSLVAMSIAGYSLANIATYNNDNVSAYDYDCSSVSKKLCSILKKNNVTLEQIESKIIQMDWTDCLCNRGSGPRERGFVMDVIEEWYNEV